MIKRAMDRAREREREEEEVEEVEEEVDERSRDEYVTGCDSTVWYGMVTGGARVAGRGRTRSGPYGNYRLGQGERQWKAGRSGRVP